MERIVRVCVELQHEGTYLGASADMPGLVARGRTVGETLDSAETLVRNLIASAGFAFDPTVVLA
jgi:predicted RNase H-like HicB family nuclease